MATTEEKQELVEDLKGPRYYRISLSGYGGEIGYFALTEKQYNYWKDLNENDEGTLINYMLDPDDFEEEITEDLDFLAQDDYRTQWYDAPNLTVHQYGADFGSSYLTVEQVSSEEWGASVVETVVDGESLSAWTDENEVEVEMGVDDTEEPAYVMQIFNSEKGGFFDGLIETYGPFDPKKLKIYTTEYWNGDDTVVNIEYNGQDIDNNGGDTNGKGTSCYFWEN
jgi:hypothetical protein